MLTKEEQEVLAVADKIRAREKKKQELDHLKGQLNTALLNLSVRHVEHRYLRVEYGTLQEITGHQDRVTINIPVEHTRDVLNALRSRFNEPTV